MTDDFVRLAVYDSEAEATLAKAVLEDNNIHTTVTGLEPSALGLSLEGDDSIALFVLQHDLESAKKLIAELAAADDAQSVPAWTCKCGEQVDEGFWVCWNCGAEHEKIE